MLQEFHFVVVLFPEREKKKGNGLESQDALSRRSCDLRIQSSGVSSGVRMRTDQYKNDGGRNGGGGGGGADQYKNDGGRGWGAGVLVQDFFSGA